jgi:NTP pyrophosphatase (non-canonical NTP hydrolase)
MYYIYHIPDKKIGMTRNLNKRVHNQQGYKPGEYEIIFSSEDVREASEMELILQKQYGYRTDRQLYTDLIKLNKMKINPTEQTSTFPVPLNKLKGNLLDNKGLKWKTSFGTFFLSDESINWIVANAKPSMYNNNRCYIYNKAFYEAFLNKKHTPDQSWHNDNPFDLIRNWAQERGIYDKGDPKTQLIKLYEESGELAQAILKNDQAGIIDAIGDSVVVLTNLAYLVNTDIETCIGAAYDEISNRTGSMKNGTFVKDTV